MVVDARMAAPSASPNPNRKPRRFSLMSALPLVAVTPLITYAVLSWWLSAGEGVGSAKGYTLISRNIVTIQSILLIISCVTAAFLASLHIRTLKLAKHAHTDELTGLANHRYLQERLAQEMGRARRYGRCLSIIMLDIDRFKQINDTHGHQVGDQALRHIAELIQDCLRQEDVAARYGGDEFVIIMPETHVDGALALAERLRQSVEDSTFEARLTGAAGRKSRGIEVHHTISVGISTFPMDAHVADELIMAADLALFAAKHASRNAVRTYHAMAQARSGRRLDPRETHLAMREGTLAAVQALAAAVDARDPDMRGHSEKVALYSLAIGHAMELSSEDMSILHKAAILHDVGSIAIPDLIHLKPGKLTDEEMVTVRNHSLKGEEILAKAPQLVQEAKIVRHHHERYDGDGYPDGLAGEDIPLASRIIAAADALDAMTSDRPYRRALLARRAMEELWKCSGTQFDPAVLEALDKLVISGELRSLLESFRDQMDLAA